MGIADFILADEGDLYDMNEYHMLAHIIIRNKVDVYGTIYGPFTIFALIPWFPVERKSILEIQVSR